MVTNILYGRTQDAWQGFVPFLTDLINEHNIERVCDIGGGSNPLLSGEYIEKRGLDYSILDISESELLKGPKHYKKILADIASHDFSINKKFDLVFSKMLAEHISDAEQFHRNVLSCLAGNGLAVHFFPTLYSLPFFVNYIVPEYLSDILLNVFAPRNRYQHEKFSAYYRSCRGPTRRQMRKFSRLGYDVVEYRGFFGHNYYNKITFLKKIHDLMTNYLLWNPNPTFTSYAYVVLKKR